MSLPSDSASDELLGRYLLGMLPEEEEERLDELSVTDDEIAIRLDSVRNDLVDAYVRGQLTGERRDRFEACFLSSPLMQRRIRFAEALHSYRPGFERGTSARRLQPTGAWWGLAAAAVLLMSVSGYLALDNLRLRHRAGQSAAEQRSQQDRERELRQQLEQQRIAAETAARDLARTREELGQLRARAETPAASRSIIASFLLAPARRGPSDATTITIPAGAGAVALRMEPEGGDFARYRVEVRRSSDDRVLWQGPDLEAVAGADGTKRVTATIPATLLTPGAYVADLSGSVPARGPATESAGSYPFRVIRP